MTIQTIRYSFISLVFLFLLGCIADSEASKRIEGVFVNPNSGAYVRLTKEGSLLYNMNPQRPNQFLEDEDPNLIEGAYAISSSGSLRFMAIDNPGTPIQFVLSTNQKKIFVAQGFPGDEVNSILVLYDPNQLELFELYNL